MSDTSRNRIFKRLQAAPKISFDPVSKGEIGSRELTIEERIKRLKQLMEAMRTEVHIVSEDGWAEMLIKIARKRGLSSVLYAPQTGIGPALERHWESIGDEKEIPISLIPYDKTVEDFKKRLFSIDAAVTTTRGAIADAGAIILWPDENEPRTMSLVPPVHFAVLHASAIYHDLSEAMEEGSWHEKLPTNALMISGPSKTADIELTLAFGVHGPKELILFIVN